MTTREALRIAQRAYPLDIVGRMRFIERRRDYADVGDELHAWNEAARLTRMDPRATRSGIASHANGYDN